jgi:uncharacterized protein YlaI
MGESCPECSAPDAVEYVDTVDVEEDERKRDRPAQKYECQACGWTGTIEV